MMLDYMAVYKKNALAYRRRFNNASLTKKLQLRDFLTKGLVATGASTS